MKGWQVQVFAVVGLIDLSQGASTGHLVLLTEAAKHGAVCLDGTPGAYYFQAGSGSGAQKWYVHHEGGGWCRSLESCAGRSKGQLGSSSSYSDTMEYKQGYLSNDPTVNPMMYNWNKVFLKYCDGGSFSGRNVTTTRVGNVTLHFRGHFVLLAMQQDLLAKGLRLATDVVVSGCSAGGLATYLHVDQWAQTLRSSCAKPPKVVGLPDSGFFLDFEGPPAYHSAMRWVYQQMNSTGGVNQRCVEAHRAEGKDWKCFFAEHTGPHLQTRMFPLQSEFDSWQVQNDLASNSSADINAYGKRLTGLMEEKILKANPENGIFLDSCSHHCDSGWDRYTVHGNTQAQAFQDWYEQGSSALHNKGYFSQNQSYPCEACCLKPADNVMTV